MKGHTIRVKLFIELTTADKIKADRTARRAIDIEMGTIVPKAIVHKNKKAYTRKTKHKVTIE
jgi:hypothetical protein